MDVPSVGSESWSSYGKFLKVLQGDIDKASLTISALGKRCAFFLDMVNVFNEPIDFKKDVEAIDFVRLCRGIVNQMSVVPGLTCREMLKHPGLSQREQLERVLEHITTKYALDLMDFDKAQLESLIEKKNRIPDHLKPSDIADLVNQLKKGWFGYLDDLSKDVDKISSSLNEEKKIYYEVDMDDTKKMENILRAASMFHVLVSARSFGTVQDAISAESFEEIQTKMMLMMVNVERLGGGWIDGFMVRDVADLFDDNIKG